MYSSFGVVCVYEVVDTRQEVSESSPLCVLSVSMFNVSRRLCYICVAKVKKSYCKKCSLRSLLMPKGGDI